MVYQFRSKAAGDLILSGHVGHRLMGILGKEPDAEGILTVDALPAAMQALDDAVAREDRQIPRTERSVPCQALPPECDAEDEAVSLRQRVWPLREMMRRANRQMQPIMWSVRPR